MAEEWMGVPKVLPGDTIGVVAPSGPIDEDRVTLALAALEQVGFRRKLSENLRARRGYLAGDDIVRAKDLTRMLADPEVHAVIAARGGYGAMRLLPYLEAHGSALRMGPKALVGFSDITALHLAFQRHHVVSLHGPVLESLLDHEGRVRPTTMASLVDGLGGKWPEELPIPEGYSPWCVTTGRARGRLVGGNLSLIAATLGTPWEIDTRGAVVLLEDVGEKPYVLDRYLTQLALAGKLQAAAGFIIGELVHCGNDSDVPTAEEVVSEHLARTALPCSAGWPFGHGAEKLTVPLGAIVEMDASVPAVFFPESRR